MLYFLSHCTMSECNLYEQTEKYDDDDDDEIIVESKVNTEEVKKFFDLP